MADVLDQVLESLHTALDLIENSGDELFNNIEDLSEARQKAVGEYVLEATRAIGTLAHSLGGVDFSLLGLAPEQNSAMSLLHAIDPSKLSADALYVLEQDFKRLNVFPSNLPSGLAAALAEAAVLRAESRAAAEADTEAALAATSSRED